ADRLIREAYAHDPRYHTALKASIEKSIARRSSAAELKGMGGEYTEAVWVLGGGRAARASKVAAGRLIRMDPEGWHRNLARLQSGLETATAGTRTPSGAGARQNHSLAEDLPVGVIGALQEDDESFFVQAVLEKESSRLRVATAVWRKVPFDEWWAGTKPSLDSIPAAEGGVISSPDAIRPVALDDAGTIRLGSFAAEPTLPSLTPMACTPDTWVPVQNTGAPTIRQYFTAIWTGAEMIVWGGYTGTSNTNTNTGGRYTPATDSWSPTAMSGAPEPRDTHTAVWTGTKMVVWGGLSVTIDPKSTGGRYDPTTNTWAATATSGAPTARAEHTAVWSGSRMVVWGGYGGPP